MIPPTRSSSFSVFPALKQYFHFTFSKIKNKSEYKQFILENPWLKEYAVFCFLKKKFKDKKWWKWPEKYQNLTDNVFLKILENQEDQLHYYYFCQYLCFLQMKQVKAYASEKNIFLQGSP